MVLSFRSFGWRNNDAPFFWVEGNGRRRYKTGSTDRCHCRIPWSPGGDSYRPGHRSSNGYAASGIQVRKKGGSSSPGTNAGVRRLLFLLYCREVIRCLGSCPGIQLNTSGCFLLEYASARFSYRRSSYRRALRTGALHRFSCD